MTDGSVSDLFWKPVPAYAWVRRLFIEVLWGMARMGTSWGLWPAEYGKGNSVYRRWAAWCDRGVWPRLMAYLQTDSDRSTVRRDSTVGRAPVSAVGAPRHKEADPARGRSRSGFRTWFPS